MKSVQASSRPEVLIAGPARMSSVDGYLQSLEALASSGLGSSELKATFQAKRDEIKATGMTVTLDTAERIYGAELKVLCAIARADAMESGRPIPTDRAIAQKVTRALDHEVHQRYYAWLKPGTEVKITCRADTPPLPATERVIAARRDGVGVLVEPLPGFEGWAVRPLGGGQAAAYALDEMEPTKPPKSPRSGVFTGR